MSHTPGPWIVIPPDSDCEHFFVARDRKAAPLGVNALPPDGHPFYVAAIPGSGGRRDIERANAAFIVRACNVHDALLAACKELKATTEAVGRLLLKPGGHTREECELAMALIQARDAIAKAEGLDRADSGR